MIFLYLSSGVTLPFAVLLLVAVASFFCAEVIASDETSPNLPTYENHLNVNANPLSHEECANSPTSCKIEDMKIVAQPIFEDNQEIDEDVFNISSSTLRDPTIANHYACPPTSLESLRKRYGTGNFWGDWSPQETRSFYKSQLPRSLQIDGSFGLSLAERAQLASQARHALRVYSRERCHLPQRLFASLYDGIRHFQIYGTWSPNGMSWEEVQVKYAQEAIRELGQGASEEDISLFIYRRVVDRASATNQIFDKIASERSTGMDFDKAAALLKSMFIVDKIDTRVKAMKLSKKSVGQRPAETKRSSASGLNTNGSGGSFTAKKRKSGKRAAAELILSQLALEHRRLTQLDLDPLLHLFKSLNIMFMIEKLLSLYDSAKMPTSISEKLNSLYELKKLPMSVFFFHVTETSTNSLAAVTNPQQVAAATANAAPSSSSSPDRNSRRRLETAASTEEVRLERAVNAMDVEDCTTSRSDCSDGRCPESAPGSLQSMRDFARDPTEEQSGSARDGLASGSAPGLTSRSALDPEGDVESIGTFRFSTAEMQPRYSTERPAGFASLAKNLLAGGFPALQQKTKTATTFPSTPSSVAATDHQLFTQQFYTQESFPFPSQHYSCAHSGTQAFTRDMLATSRCHAPQQGLSLDRSSLMPFVGTAPGLRSRATSSKMSMRRH